MKKFIIYFIAFTLWGNSIAQQDYQITHYMFDNLFFNPGSAGMYNDICVTMIGRQQWSGFTGSPQTALINVQSPVEIVRGGLGLTYISDQLGFEKNNIARLSYSYHLPIGSGRLGIGASVGIFQKSFKADWITPDQGANHTSSYDKTIPEDGANGTVPDINLGLFYKTKLLYFGLSATHLGSFNLENLNVQNVTHLWCTSGFNYDLNADIELRPSILIKSDGSSSIMDININALYKNMLWGGLSYRFGDEIAPMFGYQHPFSDGSILKVGYAYGITTSVIGEYSNGSHDLMLNYCFRIAKPMNVEKSKNPRFL
jgi:type IX secretion system PorP/SprF family membrane protein